jgi:hypothetical protein
MTLRRGKLKMRNKVASFTRFRAEKLLKEDVVRHGGPLWKDFAEARKSIEEALEDLARNPKDDGGNALRPILRRVLLGEKDGKAR